MLAFLARLGHFYTSDGYKRHRFPASRSSPMPFGCSFDFLSLRLVEELLLERGIAVSLRNRSALGDEICVTMLAG